MGRDLATEAFTTNAPKQRERLRRLMAKIEKRHQALERLVPNSDPDRLLAMTCVHEGGIPYLNASLPMLLRQVRETGLGVDLLIGLNNDAPTPEAIDSLREQGAKIVELWTDKKRYAGDRARVFDHPDRGGGDSCIRSDPEQSDLRIFLVHQARSDWSGGKPPMLLDLHGLCVRSIESGWVPGRFLLQFDDDAHLFRAPGRRNATPDPDSDGFRELLDALVANPRLGLVCPQGRLAPYGITDKKLLPDFTQKVFPFHALSNWVHGRPGAMWNISFNLSRSLLMFAISHEVFAALPGVRSEDFMQLKLVRCYGYEHAVVTGSVVTNACPPVDQTGACEEQVLRWLAGAEDITECLGDNENWIKPREALGLLAVTCMKPFLLFRVVKALKKIRPEVPNHRLDVLTGDPQW